MLHRLLVYTCILLPCRHCYPLLPGDDQTGNTSYLLSDDFYSRFHGQWYVSMCNYIVYNVLYYVSYIEGRICLFVIRLIILKVDIIVINNY